jgi:hypothetical protein
VEEARELLGDLIVATVELAQALPIPRFEKAFPVAERWFRLVAMTAAARPTDPALLDEFAAVLDHDVLGLRRLFEDAAWSRMEWTSACVARSAFEGLRDLFPDHAAIRDHADMSRIEDFMLQHGPERFAEPDVPEDTPAHHWWWFDAQPASERSLVMNDRMRSLIPAFTHIASPKFRELVAEGFVERDGLLLLRARVPAELGRVAVESPPSKIELAYNRVRMRHVLELDPSRRPVDLAASTLACARHLVCELRRLPYPRCRIVATSLESIAFHQLRDSDELLDPQGLREPAFVMLSG